MQMQQNYTKSGCNARGVQNAGHTERSALPQIEHELKLIMGWIHK
jgi:hypothetical protein